MKAIGNASVSLTSQYLRENGVVVCLTDNTIENHFQTLLVTDLADGGYGSTARYHYLVYYRIGFANFTCQNSI